MGLNLCEFQDGGGEGVVLDRRKRTRQQTADIRASDAVLLKTFGPTNLKVSTYSGILATPLFTPVLHAVLEHAERSLAI